MPLVGRSEAGASTMARSWSVQGPGGAAAERGLGLDQPVARKGPVTPDAQGPGEEVVPGEAKAEKGRAVRAVRVDGQREGERPHQMGRQAEEQAALAKPFPHQPYVP